MRAAAAYEHRPSGVLALLHRALREQTGDDGRFCTVAYAHLRVGAGTVRRSSSPAAGTRCRSSCTPTGASRRSAGSARCSAPTSTRCSPTSPSTLEPGDVLVLYTDGVTEVRRRRQEVFGHRELVDLLADVRRAAAGRGGRARRGGRAGTPRRAGCATTWRSWPSAPPPNPRRPMADPTDGAERRSRTATRTRAPTCCASSSRTCATTGPQLRQEWARRIGEARLLTALTAGGDLLRGDLGLRQLRRGARDRLASRRCRTTRATSPSASSPAASRPTRCSASCCCCATCSRARCSRSTRPTSSCSTACSTPTSRPPTASPTRWRVNFVQERERVIRQQQEAIRELSTPVLQVRERLLILPIIGVLDGQRARQLTEQLLRGIRTQPRPGGRDRHHRRADDRLHGGQPPRADRRRVAADGRHA